MPVAQPPLLTVEDYRSLPDAGPRYQLIEGELHLSPAPNRYHQTIAINLEFMLLKYLERQPIGRLYHAPFDVFLTEHDAYQPDVIFVKNENAEIFTHAGVEGAPDFVVEILSPSTAHLDKRAKRLVYARTGVKEMWLVDPEAKLIAVYHLQANAEQPVGTYSESDIFASIHFPGLSIRASDIFKR